MTDLYQDPFFNEIRVSETLKVALDQLEIATRHISSAVIALDSLHMDTVTLNERLADKDKEE